MRITILLFALIVGFTACQNSTSAYEEKVDLSKYPEALQKVFAKHGGLDTWKNMKALTYTLVDSVKGNETHYTDLKNRRDKIEGVNFKLGFDGTDIWFKGDSNYQGNPAFYHNLYFYFYAMPFVLADDGIIYSETEPLEFEGQTYPGIQISYGDSIGTSAKDEYVLYYHPETYQMEWLGYTATFYAQKKSTNFRKIRYNDWGEFNGVVLPKSLTWYNVENDLPTTPRKTKFFEEIILSKKALEEYVFEKEVGAETVE